MSLATAAALTSTPVPEPVMIEMATSGGVVAGQYDLPSEPGLTSLAIALGGEPPNILDHAQELPGGVPVVVAPPSNAKIIQLVEARADPLAQFLAAAPATSIVDCGRISTTTSLKPIFDVSALVGVVIRPSRENFQLAATTITELNESSRRQTPAGWVIVGACPWSHDEIVGQYGLPILTVIADDRLGADAVAGLRRLRRRSPLARSVRSFADDIAKHLRIASQAEPLAYLNTEEEPQPFETAEADQQYVAEADYEDSNYPVPEYPDYPAPGDPNGEHADSDHADGDYADGDYAGGEYPNGEYAGTGYPGSGYVGADSEDTDPPRSLPLPPLPGASVR